MSVSIIVISHSPQIAEGLQTLLAQAQPEVHVDATGGTDEGELGTSPEKIKNVLEPTLEGDGTVVLFDIGSARMNVELVLDMLGNPEHIVLADAPLIEGAYVAVVESGMGKSVEEVKEKAEEAKTMNKIS